ncbi:MAG: NifB/NifX family molybdenum-iron cluster-binding protein [Bacteroidota bacterium]|nr:NifB/NifX family molybdenum-iron cluster-binding protein [Bacteroidota bacterium]
MKTVITSTGNSENSKFDLRFGRAAWFCLFDNESGKLEFHENLQANAQGGAGTKAAEKMVELSIGKVISGDFGPKAKDLLEKFKIQMVILQDDGITIREIVDKIS